MEALPPTCLAECALQSAVGGLTARSEWQQPALPLSTPRPPQPSHGAAVDQLGHLEDIEGA